MPNYVINNFKQRFFTDRYYFEIGYFSRALKYTCRCDNSHANVLLNDKRICFILAGLEEENKALKTEYCRLATCADDIEAQEARLLKDLTGQLCKYSSLCC